MATRKPKETQTTAIANWDEEMAKQAQAAAAMEASTATGNFFGLKGGILTWEGAALPGNQMGVIILDSILENVFYEGAYDPDTPQSPVCFAYGRDEKTMVPHADVVANGTAQCEGCHACPKNEFGSADVGKGKACRNTRRLAMISAGTYEQEVKNGPLVFHAFEDPEQLESSPIGFMKLPVMSVKGYAGFVKQVAGALSRPPHGIFTRVFVVPDPKSQFRVMFEAIGQVPNELLGVVMQRNKEAQASIEFPYMLGEEFEQQAKPAAKRGAKAQAPSRARKY